MDARQQFEVLHGDKSDEEYIEVRFISPTDRNMRPRQHFFTDIEEAAAKATSPPAGYDSYVGVAARARPSGTRHDIHGVTTLWADIDSYKDEGRSQESVVKELQALPTPPTLIISSGGGLHVYWKLDARMDNDQAQGTMRAMAAQLRGDSATSDPARVLRVVGTSNNKLPEPRIVRAVHFAPMSVYDPAVLRERFRPATLELSGQESTITYTTQRFLEEGYIPEDAESERGFLVGRVANLRAVGKNLETIKAELWGGLVKHRETDCPKCRPEDPWTLDDVRKIVESIFQTEPRPLQYEVPPPIEFKVASVASGITGRMVPLVDADVDSRNTELDYVVDKMLLNEEVVLVTGGYGVGKSWLSLDLALAISDEERTHWIGQEVQRHGKVVYIDEENSQDVLLDRLVRLGYREGLLGRSLFVYPFAGVKLDDPAWTRELHQLAQTLEPTLFVFDTFIRFFSGVDENDNTAISQSFQQTILPLSRQYGSAVMILDHPRKGSAEISRGASDKVNAVDRALAVVGTPGEDNALIKHVKPPRRGREPLEVAVTRTENISGITIVGKGATQWKPAGH